MAKLTRVQKQELASALYHAQRAYRYLMADTTAIARRSKGTTTLDYTRSDGAALYEVAKDMGSDLCGLPDCIKRLEQVLALHS